MTDELVECFNCGRSNPEWAQVCRACGVPLRHGEPLLAPDGRVPTDRDSILSIAAVIGTILAAAVLGLVLSGLNPTDPAVAGNPATPTPTPTEEPSPSESVAASETPLPTESVAPALPGTLTFGTQLDDASNVVDPTTTFTPGMNLAYSVALPGGFGTDTIQNEVVRVEADGTEATVVPREAVQVDPAAEVFGYSIGDAAQFVLEWRPGEYEWRVYIADQLIASSRLTLSEG
jgi:hypothetical protein